MGYFLIRTHLIQFLPIPQSSIANLRSTDVPQFPMASNMVGFIGMLSNPQRLAQALSSTVAILAQGTSWADAATQASTFVNGGSIPGAHTSQSVYYWWMHKCFECDVWAYLYSCSPLGPW